MKSSLIGICCILLSWHAWTQKATLGLPTGHTKAITAIAYSPDGQYILSGGADNIVRLWNLEGRVIHTLNTHQSPITKLVFSESGQYFVSESENLACVWSIFGDLLYCFGDTLLGQSTNAFATCLMPAPDDGFVFREIQPDSDDILNLSSTGEVFLFRAIIPSTASSDEGQITFTSWDPLPERPLDFSPDGTRMLYKQGGEYRVSELNSDLYASILITWQANSSGRYDVGFLSDTSIYIWYGNGRIETYDLPGGHREIIRRASEIDTVLHLEPYADQPGLLEPLLWGSLWKDQEEKEIYLNSFLYYAYNDDVLRDNEPEDYRDAPPFLEDVDVFNSIETGKSLGHVLGLSHDHRHFLIRHQFNKKVLLFDAEGTIQLVVNDLYSGLDSLDYKWYGMEQRAPTVAFSPDSNHLVVGFSTGTIAIIDFDGNLVRNFDKNQFNRTVDIAPTAAPGQLGFVDEYGQVGDVLIANKHVFAYRPPGPGGKFLINLTNGVLDSVLPPFLDDDPILNFKGYGYGGIYTDLGKYPEVAVSSPDQTFKCVGYKEVFPHLTDGNDFININLPIFSFFDSEPVPFMPSLGEGLVRIMDDKDEILVQFFLSLPKIYGKYNHPIEDLLISPDNKYLFVSTRNSISTWDFDCLLHQGRTYGKDTTVFEGHPKTLYPNELSRFLNKKNCLPCRKAVVATPTMMYFLSYDPSQQKLFLSDGQSSAFHMADTAGNIEKTFTGHQLPVIGAHMIKEGEFVVSWSEDRTKKFWRTDTEEEAGTLVFFTDEGWLFITPSGLFDGSENAISQLYYTVDLEVIEIEQLRENFYQPDLIPRVLGYSDLGVRETIGLDEIPLYPKMDVQLDSTWLKIRLYEQGGGIGKVSVFLNGKERIPDANPMQSGQSSRDSVITIKIDEYTKYLKAHPDSLNTLEVRAYNQEGWLRSRPQRLTFASARANPRGEGDTGMDDQTYLEEADFYALVVGTSNYAGEKLNLGFADQDAKVIALALEQVSRELFTPAGEVSVTCLNTTPADSLELQNQDIAWNMASKKNIEAALREIDSKAKEKDVLFIYFSGHGIALDSSGKSQFHYLTKDLSNFDLDRKTVRDLYSFSGEELTHWVNTIAASKVLIIIDACGSGQAIADMNSKDISDGQMRAYDRMRYSTGTYILAGSASNKLSYEAKQFGQGLLTYAVIEGLLEAVVEIRNNKYIDVSTLLNHCKQEVISLSESIGIFQRPVIGTPKGGSSFYIGLLTDDVKIQRPDKKPMFTFSTFFNPAAGQDDLQLSQAVDNRLLDLSERGANSKLVFIPARHYGDAYTISGSYTVDPTGQITVNAFLFKNRQKLGTLPVAPTTNVNTLAKTLVLEAKALVGGE